MSGSFIFWKSSLSALRFYSQIICILVFFLSSVVKEHLLSVTLLKHDQEMLGVKPAESGSEKEPCGVGDTVTDSAAETFKAVILQRARPLCIKAQTERGVIKAK